MEAGEVLRKNIFYIFFFLQFVELRMESSSSCLLSLCQLERERERERERALSKAQRQAGVWRLKSKEEE